MNYLNTCIAENKLNEASTYIRQTCENIDNARVVQYSGNEPLNLILSSYADRAKRTEITTEIKVTAIDFSRFQITDLCSLLSNALENAIHSCSKIENPCQRWLKVRIYEKNNKLCL